MKYILGTLFGGAMLCSIFFSLPTPASACYGCPTYTSFYANPYNYYNAGTYSFYGLNSFVNPIYSYDYRAYQGYSYTPIAPPVIYSPGIPQSLNYTYGVSPVIYSPSLPYNGGYTSTYYPDYSYSYSYAYPYYR